MKYRLAIFDLDGTILDTLNDLADAVNYSLSKFGFPKRNIEEVRTFVGNGMPNLIKRSCPENTEKATLDKVYSVFTNFYKKHNTDKTKPYDEIVNLLKKLKENGYKLSVVSNKDDYAVKDLCKLYFDGIFAYTLGRKDGIKNKPDAEPVNFVISEAEVTKSEAVYIGDSEVDVLTAKNAEIPLIAVSWGFRDKETLVSSGAKDIANTVKELEKFLI